MHTRPVHHTLRLILIMLSAVLTVSCFLASEEYPLTYHANIPASTTCTGSVPQTEQYPEGAEVPIYGNTGGLIVPGFIFSGWNTAADGSGTAFKSRTDTVMEYGGLNLYAQWDVLLLGTPIQTYYLGGPGQAGGTIVFDDTIDLFDDLPDADYLEAAPQDWYDGENDQFGQVTDGSDPVFAWGGYKQSIATGTSIGTGNDNTVNMVSSLGTDAEAAFLCSSTSIGGYQDWFLPSIDELQLMYTNDYLSNPASYSIDWFYISSSEDNRGEAFYYSFLTDESEIMKKYTPGYVRPMRKF